MKPFMLFCFAVLSTLCSYAQIEKTADGEGYVFKPVPPSEPAMFIEVQDVVFKKTEDGRLDIYILKDEILSELEYPLILRPRVFEEKISEAFYFPLSEKLGKYTFSETSLFSIDEGNRLLFQGKLVDAFEVVIPSGSSHGL